MVSMPYPPRSFSITGRRSGLGPGCVKTRNDRRQSINFSRFSAVFRHYRLGEANKFASDAPFSGNFRVFTQPGPIVAVDGRSQMSPWSTTEPQSPIRDAPSPECPWRRSPARHLRIGPVPHERLGQSRISCARNERGFVPAASVVMAELIQP